MKWGKKKKKASLTTFYWENIEHTLESLDIFMCGVVNQFFHDT